MYGLIGAKLTHSFSAVIHSLIGSYNYELIELTEGELDVFFKEKKFCAVNVTIPYKQAVIPYLDEIDGHAKKIGSVNTVVNKGGRLVGYNTDFYGMTMLARRICRDFSGKRVAILGSGGTAKTAYAVSQALDATEIFTVSRGGGDGKISYTELYAMADKIDYIINATPVGMYPDNYSSPIEIDKFPSLLGVIDAVYNPLVTELVGAARERGIPAVSGLYMLVAQAIKASEYFFDTVYDSALADRIYQSILRDKTNIVLIGMPSSGKSTVGTLLADMLGRSFIDTDREIEKSCGMSIHEIFEKHGEEYFRKLEADAVRTACRTSGAVIATGGGAVLKEGNVFAMKQNGRIYFIDRPLESLIPTSDRPLSKSREALSARYLERYPIYLKAADKTIDADTDAQTVANAIKEDFCK
ncbi:MAG: shikimate dehydrogenase [Clostridia bacterium]|nr:shikimate dehydrogenase [Clostridia bacterium]